MRADFAYREPPLVILTDGRVYHASDPLAIVEDLDRRNALVLSGHTLLEVTYRDVFYHPETILAMVQRALAADAAAPPAPFSIGSTALLPSTARSLVEDLCRRNTGFRPGGYIHLDNGSTLDALAMHPEKRLALLLVDEEQWIREPGAWQQSLTRHNQARLEGWRLVRMPTLWLSSPRDSR